MRRSPPSDDARVRRASAPTSATARRRSEPPLDALPGIVAVSELRETDPVGVVDQPPFLNGAAALETELSPRELLDVLLAVERELGRERRERWGPRTIDLDLLLYGDESIDEPGLTVPHPRLHERRFALEPLARPRSRARDSGPRPGGGPARRATLSP